MEISQKLYKFKFHISFALAFSLLIFSLIYLAPRFLDLLAYFWPLLVSTAMFLVAVVLFAQTSPPAVEAPGEKAGEGLLDFVAGQPVIAAVEVVQQPELTGGGEESSKSEQNM